MRGGGPNGRRLNTGPLRPGKRPRSPRYLPSISAEIRQGQQGHPSLGVQHRSPHPKEVKRGRSHGESASGRPRVFLVKCSFCWTLELAEGPLASWRKGILMAHTATSGPRSHYPYSGRKASPPKVFHMRPYTLHRNALLLGQTGMEGGGHNVVLPTSIRRPPLCR